MFCRIARVVLVLTFVSSFLCFPLYRSAEGDTWKSQDPADLQPIANTRWLLIYSFDGYDSVDQLVLGGDVFTFEDGTAYLECNDQTGNFWGIVQYGELASHNGENGYLMTYYDYGSSDTDGTFYLWDFIKTNGLETGDFSIEDEATGVMSESLPHIAVRIDGNYAPSVVLEVTGDDRMGLADIIWNLQTLTGVR